MNETLGKLIDAAKPQSFGDFMVLAKKLQGDPEVSKNLPKKIKIAFLTSFTTKGLKEILWVKCLRLGIAAEIYTADYNQYAQEILNPKSGLFQFEPDLVVLFIDLQSLLGELYFRPYQISGEDRRAWIQAQLDQLRFFVEHLKTHSRAHILIHNFEVPLHSPLANLETKQNFGFRESIQTLNLELVKNFAAASRVFLFDYDLFAARLGKQTLADPKMVYLGDLKLDLRHMPALAEAYMDTIKPLLGLTRKCLVLDLDNTLWGGIVGEDGLDGIHLGPTPEGRAFWEFQQHLLGLFDRGVILAVNSRNNPKEALQVIREHPHMLLKEKHFASLQINWNDKASNLKVIAQEINIGMDSLAFFDDDKINRDFVRQALPEVFVIEVPEDPSLYSQTLLALNDFNTLQLTEEDQQRGASYAAQRLREDLKQGIDLKDYLKNLQTTVTVEKATSFNLPRMTQLTQKTNQFNMTTRRYGEADIERFSRDSSWLVLGFSVTDKFGPSGLVGVILAEKNKEIWRLDTFLMSCRVLGRKIEETMLTYVMKEAHASGAKKMVGEFIPTEKNAPAKIFYKEQAFQLQSKKDKMEIWEKEIRGPYTFAEGITIK